MKTTLENRTRPSDSSGCTPETSRYAEAATTGRVALRTALLVSVAAGLAVWLSRSAAKKNGHSSQDGRVAAPAEAGSLPAVAGLNI